VTVASLNKISQERHLIGINHTEAISEGFTMETRFLLTRKIRENQGKVVGIFVGILFTGKWRALSDCVSDQKHDELVWIIWIGFLLFILLPLN